VALDADRRHRLRAGLHPAAQPLVLAPFALAATRSPLDVLFGGVVFALRSRWSVASVHLFWQHVPGCIRSPG